ncbi:MAG: hypothetical protein K0S07_162 [Chlamydiales bacterium]|nr:hypothetical protein [Chlamydiales bacterium]
MDPARRLEPSERVQELHSPPSSIEQEGKINAALVKKVGLTALKTLAVLGGVIAGIALAAPVAVVGGLGLTADLINGAASALKTPKKIVFLGRTPPSRLKKIGKLALIILTSPIIFTANALSLAIQSPVATPYIAFKTVSYWKRKGEKDGGYTLIQAGKQSFKDYSAGVKEGTAKLLAKVSPKQKSQPLYKSEFTSNFH